MMLGLLEAPATLEAASDPCIEGLLSTTGSAWMSRRGRCCRKAAVSSEMPMPSEGLGASSSASLYFRDVEVLVERN